VKFLWISVNIISCSRYYFETFRIWASSNRAYCYWFDDPYRTWSARINYWRQTGKTAVATDTILNQQGQNVICVYVGYWSKSIFCGAGSYYLPGKGSNGIHYCGSRNGGFPATLQYLAPYTGAALAEYFMYRERHTLIIYHDLSKQAQAYRRLFYYEDRRAVKLIPEMFFICCIHDFWKEPLNQVLV